MEEPISMGSKRRVAVVTGANKGVGLEISRQLASNGITVLLTARDERRGIEAVEKLKKSGTSDVLFHQLDVADPSSVASLEKFIKTQFGQLDILVNNAGVNGVIIDYHSLPPFEEEENDFIKVTKLFEMARETYEMAAECLNINYYGMKRVTETLIPLLLSAQSPRIVNVSSHGGLLSVIPSESIRKEMGRVDENSELRLDEVLKSFLNDMKEGKIKENGWPTNLAAYKLSKVAISTYTRILARKYPTVCTNCVSPGFVKTDITHNLGLLTAEEGAKGAVMLALLPDGSPSGLFYDKTEAIPFDSENVY